MFSFFRNRRREALTNEPFPEEWMEYIRQNVSHFEVLTEAERKQLLDDLRIFRAEKNWEGAGGLKLTDEITVTISALACLLTLALPEQGNYYRGVETVIVYPSGYRVAETRMANPAGVLESGESWRLGEAWHGGPVILSWAAARAGGQGRTPGSNVVLHEFAHKLDMEDGAAEGTPRLHSDEQYDEWHRVMNTAYNQFRARLWWRHTHFDQDLVLDPYGATDAAEFFAVATEAFFERPRALHRHWRVLYNTLKDYYRQDPAARVLRYLRQVPRAERILEE